MQRNPIKEYKFTITSYPRGRFGGAIVEIVKSDVVIKARTMAEARRKAKAIARDNGLDPKTVALAERDYEMGCAALAKARNT